MSPNLVSSWTCLRTSQCALFHMIVHMHMENASVTLDIPLATGKKDFNIWKCILLVKESNETIKYIHYIQKKSSDGWGMHSLNNNLLQDSKLLLTYLGCVCSG